MLIRDVFRSDVTRPIPPVVYFHDQHPEKVLAEVSEYIITGGWPESHPNHGRRGIHEEYVRLLTAIVDELERPGGADLPTAWISGFYGSGKSSFAKLLGLALNGMALPDHSSLADAWLARDTSPMAHELRDAWQRLRQKIDPIAVVFDIGSAARDGEHVHRVAMRQVQHRLGYASGELVALEELAMERDGVWGRFEALCHEVFQKSWAELRSTQQVEKHFSLLMHHMHPQQYSDPNKWLIVQSLAATQRASSPEESVAAIRDMLAARQPRATLFLVIDEVSQYILGDRERVDRLRAFATELGAKLRGKVWLFALGQQKLDEGADDSFLVWAKDRFPPKLRVHLAPTNIRDVVHKRLLEKKPAEEKTLTELFARHRADLKLHAYGCESVTPDEFVQVYPMLPGQIDLILQITSALRTRSTRAQGDDQAIRGLLQLLGELFREQKLADQQVGALVTMDQIYEVQHTALDSEVQASMSRVLNQCDDPADATLVRVAKAVAMLEQIQESIPTDARLIAQCLYERIDRGNNAQEVSDALEQLRQRNLLSFSEKSGYKLQSSVGEEWESERKAIPAPRDMLIALVQEALKYLAASPEAPKLQGRPFPWVALFSTVVQPAAGQEVRIKDSREEATITLDLRLLTREESGEADWIKRSADSHLQDRLIWVCHERDMIEDAARTLHRSRVMIKKYEARYASMPLPKQSVYHQECHAVEAHERRLQEAVAEAWMQGKLYFRGLVHRPRERGGTWATSLLAIGQERLPAIYPAFLPTQISPGELMQLLEETLVGPSPKFLSPELHILTLDAGRYIPDASAGASALVFAEIQRRSSSTGAVKGHDLISAFGGPPYGYAANVVKACVAGLLRGSKIKVLTPTGAQLTSLRDAGARDLFEKDREFRGAMISFKRSGLGVRERARICEFFEMRLRHALDREDHLIADAVARLFPPLATRARRMQERLRSLPSPAHNPFERFSEIVDQAIQLCRETEPTVEHVHDHLTQLHDGVQLLDAYELDLTEASVNLLRHAHETHIVLTTQLHDLKEELPGHIDEAAARIRDALQEERPWRQLSELEEDVAALIAFYTDRRQRLILDQESQVQAARQRVKGRQGFSTLTADQSNQVLRPIALTSDTTSSEARSPALIYLRDIFKTRLVEAEEEANDILDQLLSHKTTRRSVPIHTGLKHRELHTEEDVEALLLELKQRLMEYIKRGESVRLT